MTLLPDRQGEHRTALVRCCLRTIHLHCLGHLLLPVLGHPLVLNVRPVISLHKLPLGQERLVFRPDEVPILALEVKSEANHLNGVVQIPVLTVPSVVRLLFKFHLP